MVTKNPRSRPTLPVAEERGQALGRDTIMDRALAATHGAAYVRLAAFAIDVDRVREVVEELESIGDASIEGSAVTQLGWDVFLTERYVLDHLDPASDAHRTLLEEMVEGVLGLEAGESPLGSQVAFAVYDAVRRGALPAELGRWFRRWKSRPDRMLAALDPWFEAPGSVLSELAALCLEAEIEPPLAPPTRQVLEQYVTADDEEGAER